MKIDTSKIAPSTIVRTLVLMMGLINLALTMWGKNPLPFKDQDIAEFVAYFWAGASAIWAWWKNNSFTEPATRADEYKAAVRAAAALERFSPSSGSLSGLDIPVLLDTEYEDEEDEEYDDEDEDDEEDIPEEDYDPEEDGDEDPEEDA